MNRLTLLACAVAVTLSGACGSTSSDTTVGPTPVRCGVSVTPNPRSFSHGGGDGSLAVSAARECAWTASTQAAWISLATPIEGQGDGSVRYTVARNPNASVRRGSLTVNGQTTEVTQEAAPCTFDLDRRSFDVGAAAGTITVRVQAPDGCTWTASSGVPWISVASGASGSGAGEARFTVTSNTVPTARTARVTVAGIEVTVRQQAAGTTPPPPDPGDPGDPGACTFALNPASAEAGAQQSDGAFQVITESACTWTASSDAGWLSILAGGSGTGPGQVSYRAAENTSTSGRTGAITVNGVTFTLTQQGAAIVCNYQISPTSRSVGTSGGTGTVDVDAGALCAWSATSNVAWIQVLSGSSGMGNGKVDYRVDANSGDARTGVIRIAGRDFTVTQAATIVTLNGEVRDLSKSCPNSTFTVNGQRVRTTSATSFMRGSCGNHLQNGRDVRVRGPIGSDGVLNATEVRF